MSQNKDNQPSRVSWSQWLYRHRLQLSTVLFWGTVLFFSRQYMQDHQLTFEALVNTMRQAMQGNWYGPLIYIVAYLVRPLTFIPSFLLTILAGNIFGLGFGFLVALLAGTLSALPTYIFGRWFSTEEPTNNSSNKLLNRFIGLLHEHPFQAIFLIRLLYLPYDPVNLFAGYMRIPLRAYLLGTLLGNIPTTLVYIALGASIQGDPVTGQFSLNPNIIGLSAGLFIITFGLSWAINKRQASLSA